MIMRISFIFFLWLAVVPPLYSQLKLEYPAGGEAIRTGKEVVIRWSGVPETDIVSLEFSSDAGATWQNITQVADHLQYRWTVPSVISNTCLIRVSRSPGALTLVGHTSRVTEVGFSKDGTRAVSTDDKPTSIVWNTLTGTLLHRLNNADQARYSPTEERIVSFKHGTVQEQKLGTIWDAESGADLHTLTGHIASVATIRISPTGTRVVTGGKDSTARVWDVATGELLHTLGGHRQQVGRVRFTADGSKIVTLSLTPAVAMVWDVETGQLLQTIRDNTYSMVGASITPDGSKIVTWGPSGGLSATARIPAVLWDVNTGARIREFALKDIDVVTAIFSPDGSKLATGCSDSAARIWDVASGEELHVLRGHSYYRVNYLAYSRDGSRLLTADGRTSVNVWNASTGMLFKKLIGHRSVEFSAYGVVVAAEFSPDGKRVITAGTDSTVKIWDLENIQLETAVSAASFSIWPPLLGKTEIDFDSVAVGGYHDTLVKAMLRNPGAMPLRIDGARFRGADSARFKLVSPSVPFDVPPAGELPIVIRFSPTGTKSYSTTLQFLSAVDSDGVTLRGTGVRWLLGSPIRVIDFGQVVLKTHVDTTVEGIVRNVSSSPVRIDSIRTTSILVFSTTPLDARTNILLQPGEALTLGIHGLAFSLEKLRHELTVYYQGAGAPLRIGLWLDGVRGAGAEDNTEMTSSEALTCWPNPSSGGVRVRYRVGQAGPVRMELRDMLGRRVKVLLDEDQPAGEHSFDGEMGELASGAYLLVLSASDEVHSRRMEFVR